MSAVAILHKRVQEVAKAHRRLRSGDPPFDQILDFLGHAASAFARPLRKTSLELGLDVADQKVCHSQGLV
jgi:hypothetical protein